MIWTSLKLVVLLDNACYALSLDTERSIVPNTTKALILDVGEVTEDEEVVGNVASTLFVRDLFINLYV